MLLQVEVLQDVEHLDERDAAGTRRRRAVHVVAAIGAVDRLALVRLVRRQVVLRDEPAAGLHLLLEQLGRARRCRRRPAPSRRSAAACGRGPSARACRRPAHFVAVGLAVDALELGVRRLRVGEHAVQPAREHRVDGEAVLGQLRPPAARRPSTAACRTSRGPAPARGRCPARRPPCGRARSPCRRRRDRLSPRPGRSRGTRCRSTSLPGGGDHHEPAAADVARPPATSPPSANADRDRRIDGVAALLQDRRRPRPRPAARRRRPSRPSTRRARLRAAAPARASEDAGRATRGSAWRDPTRRMPHGSLSRGQCTRAYPARRPRESLTPRFS